MGDNSKLRNATGWEPKISIEEIVSEIMGFWRERTRAAAVLLLPSDRGLSNSARRPMIVDAAASGADDSR